MPYDGNGNFVRVHNWTADAANALDINATEMDAEDNGFASGLSNAVTRDGQGKMTVDFLPNADNTLNLGSGSKRWASINGVPIPAANVPWNFYPQTAQEATAGVTPVAFFYQPGDIRRYGGLGDGTTDNYTAFVNAINVCKQNGATLYVPAGNFKIDTASGTLNPIYCTIQGSGVIDGSATPASAGSVLSIVSTTNSPFTTGPGWTLQGVAIFYPAQVDSASPIVFPPTIATSLAVGGAINFVYIEDCTVFNAYRFFVDTDTTGAIGHIYLQNCTIYGILTCFELQYNAEIITITDNEFTFGHYLAATETGLRSYTRANGSVLKVVQSDGITFQGNVCFGYQNGLNLVTNTTGGNGGVFQQTSITGNYFDQCLFPLNISGNGNFILNAVSANFFNALNNTDHTQIGNCIKITTTGSVGQEHNTISDNVFSLCTGDMISVSGNTPNRLLTLSGNVFTGWGVFQTTGTYSALNISGNSTSFQAIGNQVIAQFGSGATLNGITCSCSLAHIGLNVFGLCNEALNVSAGSTLSIGNISFSTSGTAANNYAFVSTTIDIGNKWDKDALQVTGFGTPTGGAVVANFPGATATLVQTSETVAEILTILKAKGIIAA